MKTAIILPCYNEGAAIFDVVSSFRNALPDAEIYVFDNNSSDNTAEEARRAGAVVQHISQRGKGNVVRHMFADVEADIYLMADGDGTYDASYAPKLVDALVSGANDMVVGTRQPQNSELAYRRGHVTGNKLLTGFVRFIFGTGFTDMLSGYRAFSKRFVKTFPAFSSGFEIETELTIHALRLNLSCDEVATPYFERAEGSNSKLSTYKDGFRILFFILFLFKEHKPFPFFGLISLLLATLSVVLAIPVIIEFLETGLVPRIPTVLLSTGIMITGILSFITGVILDSVSRGRKENLKLHFLKHSSVRELKAPVEKTR